MEYKLSNISIRENIMTKSIENEIKFFTPIFNLKFSEIMVYFSEKMNMDKP